MRLLTLALATSVVGLSSVGAFQDSQPAPQRFRASTRLVQVSVVVHDRRNRGIHDLRQQEFQLLEDGKELPLAFFLPAVGAAETAAAPSRGAAAPPATDVFTNRIPSPSTGGVVAIVFDQLNTAASQQARAREHILKYLGSLRSGDRVALYVLAADGMHVLYDFTTDAETLVRALKAIDVGAAAKLGISQEQLPAPLIEGLSAFALGNLTNMQAALDQLRSETTLQGLESVSAHLEGVPGRKNIIWISSGFPFMIAGATPAGPITMIQAEQTKRATRALNSSDVALYPVDARGLVSGRGAAVPTLDGVYKAIEGLRVAADWTGGKAFFNSNDIGGAIKHAVEDSRYTYVLGYYPTNDDWSGRFRNIKVHVSRPGLDVRHRAGYYAHPPVQSTPDVRQRAMLEALASPLEATTLPFAVTATGSPDRMVLRIHLDPGAVTFSENGQRIDGEIDIAITQLLDDRRQVPEMTSAFPISVPVADKQRLLAQPVQLTRTMALAANTRQVRVVVRDARSGALGSVFVDAERLRTTLSRMPEAATAISLRPQEISACPAGDHEFRRALFS